MAKTSIKNVFIDTNNLNDNDSDDNTKDPDFECLEPSAKKIKDSEDIFGCDLFTQQLKNALSSATSNSERISLLAVVPHEWSMYKICKVFNVSRRIVARANKMRVESVHGGVVDRNKARNIDEHIRHTIINFYLSEENSRILPGRKDHVSTKVNGVRILKQKRLLYGNISELFEQFKTRFPMIKISLSTFAKYRPEECISAGKPGTHNVCVCKIHENMRLKCDALRDALSKKCVKYSVKYHTYFNEITCAKATTECYFSNCDKCPGTTTTYNKLKTILDKAEVFQIIVRQWSSTDRYKIRNIYLVHL